MEPQGNQQPGFSNNNINSMGASNQPPMPSVNSNNIQSVGVRPNTASGQAVGYSGNNAQTPGYSSNTPMSQAGPIYNNNRPVAGNMQHEQIRNNPQAPRVIPPNSNVHFPIGAGTPQKQMPRNQKIKSGNGFWYGLTVAMGHIMHELLHIMSRAIKVVLFFFAILMVLGIIGLFLGKETGSLGSIESRVIHKGANSDEEIAVVRLQGAITNNNQVQTAIGSRAYVSLLKQLANQDDIKGIVLVVDSPGGEVYAADELYKTISIINQKIPVYIYAESLLASGAYYFSMGASKVYTSDLTIVGSIGVIMEMYNYDDLLNKVGIRVRKMTNTGGVYKTGDGLFDKDPNGPEDKLYQRILDATYMKFVNIVAKGRNLPKQKVISVADGRVMIASDAKSLGLIDKITTFWGTIKDMENAYKTGDVNIVEYYLSGEPTWLKPFASANAFVKFLTSKPSGETRLMYIYTH